MKYARLLAAGSAALLLSAYPTNSDAGLKGVLKKIRSQVVIGSAQYDSLMQAEEKRQRAYIDSIAAAGRREQAILDAAQRRQQLQIQQAEDRRQMRVHKWMDEVRHYEPNELMTAKEIVQYIDGMVPTTTMTVKITRRGSSGEIGPWKIQNDTGPIDFDSETNVFTYNGINAIKPYDQHPYTLQFTKFGNLQTVTIPTQENVVWYVDFLHGQHDSFADTFFMLAEQASPYLDGCGEVGLNVSNIPRGDLAISRASISGKGNGRKFVIALYYPDLINSYYPTLFQNDGQFILDNFQKYLQFGDGDRVISRELISPKGKPWRFFIQKSEPAKTSTAHEF